MNTIQEAVKAGAITVVQAAKALGVTRGRVIHLIREGKIRVVFKETLPGRTMRYWLHKDDVAKEAASRKARRIK